MIESYGTVKYGTYEFPSTYNTKLSSDVTYAEGSPSRKFITNTLTIEFIINFDDIVEGVPNPNGSENIDTYMRNLRFVLLKPRQDLYFTHQGSGMIAVLVKDRGITGACENSVVTEIPALNDTPKPISFAWEPIAANRAARVVWTCEFATRDCVFNCGETNNEFFFDVFDFSRTFSINDEGVSQITTEFTYEVRSRYSNDSTNISADYYDEHPSKVPSFFQEVPVGFKRTKQTHTFDKTLRKINVVLVDEEIPSGNPLFPYTINIEATHTVSSSLNPNGKLKGSGFFSWDNAFEATIRVAPGYPVGIAELIFRWLLWQRFGIVGKQRRISVDDSGEKPRIKIETSDYKEEQEVYNILLSYEIEENIYSREANFRATYYGVYKLSRLLQQTGLFHPIYTRKDDLGRFPWKDGYLVDREKEYANYQASVQHITDYRGYRRPTNGKFKVVFDPCIDTDVYRDAYSLYNPYEVTPVINVTSPEESTISDDLLTNYNESGYLKYHNEFEIIEIAQTASIGIQQYDTAIDEYKRTKSDELPEPGTPNYDKFLFNNKVDSETSTSYKPSALTGISGDSSFILVMKGYGVRHKKPVTVPSLTSFNNQYVYRIGVPVVAQKQVTEGEEPLYVAKWRIEYSIDSAIKGDIFAQMRGNVFQGNNKVT